TTRRSYSRTTFRPLAASASRIRISTMLPGMGYLLLQGLCGGRPHAETQSVDGDHLHGLSGLDGSLAGRGPVLTAHEHDALRVETLARDADGAQHPFAASGDPAALRANDEGADDQADEHERPRGAGDQAAGDGEPGSLGIEEEERPEHERHQSAHAEHA